MEIAVYGTLRRGEALHDVLQRGLPTFVGYALVEPYRVIRRGRVPVAFKVDASVGGLPLEVEVWRFMPSFAQGTLADLDQLELGYDRVRVEAKGLPDAPHDREVWMYEQTYGTTAQWSGLSHYLSRIGWVEVEPDELGILRVPRLGPLNQAGTGLVNVNAISVASYGGEE